MRLLNMHLKRVNIFWVNIFFFWREREDDSWEVFFKKIPFLGRGVKEKNHLNEITSHIKRHATFLASSLKQTPKKQFKAPIQTIPLITIFFSSQPRHNRPMKQTITNSFYIYIEVSRPIFKTIVSRLPF